MLLRLFFYFRSQTRFLKMRLCKIQAALDYHVEISSFADVPPNRSYKYFTILTRKQLCWSLFLIKLIQSSLRLQHRYFLVHIVKVLRTGFAIEQRWLLST